ncbi:MAG: hypothetical protein JXR76_12620 [Deltaproteobacteria bacterium]|nr:hypothetical protein [Deltaproteobacteria bacterium]
MMFQLAKAQKHVAYFFLGSIEAVNLQLKTSFLGLVVSCALIVSLAADIQADVDSEVELALENQKRETTESEGVVIGSDTETLAIAPIMETPLSAIQKVAVTSKGGISLGAYEAGLQWALMELLRERAFFRSSEADGEASNIPYPQLKVDLVASAGASAGNANTFLGLFNYCRPDKQSNTGLPRGGAYADNWFWNTWVPLGIDQLFPQTGMTTDEYCKVLGESEQEMADCKKRMTTTLYENGDGLLSRFAYQRMKHQFNQIVNPHGKAVLQRECLYPVGVPLNQTSAEEIHWGNASSDSGALMTSPATRAVISFQTECATDNGDPSSGECSIRLVNYHWNAGAGHIQRLGRVLQLPYYAASSSVRADDITGIVEAGSAVPLAYGPVKLNFCDSTGETPLDAGMRCMNGETATRSRWWNDGGLLDNLPIGLAYEMILNESESRSTLNTHLSNSKETNGSAVPNNGIADAHFPSDKGNVHLIALDVKNMRYNERVQKVHVPPQEGLFGVIQATRDVLPVAHTYELQALSRYFPYGVADTSTLQGTDTTREKAIIPVATSRYFPVVGSSLLSFGAFLGQPFREYDYHMGVYDAIHYIAKAMCVGFGKTDGAGDESGFAQPPWAARVTDNLDVQRCIVDVFRDSYKRLGFPAVLPNGNDVNDDNVALISGAVAVLTALQTELHQTGRFAGVGGFSFEQFTGKNVPDTKSLLPLFGRDTPTNDQCDAFEDEMVNEKNKFWFMGKWTSNRRFRVFHNLLRSGQCIALYGPQKHPTYGKMVVGKVLGDEFLYFVSNLKLVENELTSLRTDFEYYLAHSNERRRPPYMEAHFKKKASWKTRQNLVQNPESWTRDFLHRIFGRLRTLNRQDGIEERVAEMIQMSLEFLEREDAVGVRFGPSIVPFDRARGGKRFGLAMWKLFVPYFVGRSFEVYAHQKRGMLTTIEWWSLFGGFPGGQVTLAVAPQLLYQRIPYHRVAVGGAVKLGFRTKFLFVSQLGFSFGIAREHNVESPLFQHESPWMLNVDVDLYILGSVLRIFGGVRQLGLRDAFDERDSFSLHVGIGINDIPGILYWLGKLAM